MLFCVRAWILLSALLVGGGWILSAVHQLNRPGYLGLFLLGGLLAVWAVRQSAAAPGAFPRAARKIWRRWRRPLPFLFLALVLMSLAAGWLHCPNNGDSNSYRIPRVFHWLGHEQWHWIHSLDERLNIVGCGYEWLAAPIMLFTRSDGYIFLVNTLAFALLPGLIFSVFTRLGVPSRVAWWWMWLLPSGWCYAMQAASDVNDSFAVIYALAAVDLALRGIARKNVSDLWLSLLAAALLTGTKQTSIPLVVLWAIAIGPGVGLLLRRPLGTLLTSLAGLLVSALPLAIFNLRHTGVWTGLSPNLTPTSPLYGTLPTSPFWSVLGNLFCLPVQNLKPPVFPWTARWGAMLDRFLQTPFGHHFSSFEAFGALSSGTSETNAGIGLSLCVFTLVSVLAALGWRGRYAPVAVTAPRFQIGLLRWVPFLLLLVFMAKVVSYQNARQLGPYYVFFFPCLLVAPGHLTLVRQQWWRIMAVLVMLSTAFLLVVARNRPLFPARTLITQIEAKYPHASGLTKSLDTFFWISVVENTRAFIAHSVPPNEPVIGYATDWSTLEPAMWLPFGQRRVERVLPTDSPAELRRQNIHYVYVDFTALHLPGQPPETIEHWMAQRAGRLVDQMDLSADPVNHRLMVGSDTVAEAVRLYLVQLPGATGSP